jgi:hypothetical protein
MNFLHNLGRAFDDPPTKRAKRGRRFTFHGSFKHKADAVAKERSTPHAFIQERKGRYVVMTENR